MGISPVDCHTPLGFAMTRGIFLRSPKEHLPILRPCRGQCPHWPIKISCVVRDDVGIVPYKLESACTFRKRLSLRGRLRPWQSVSAYMHLPTVRPRRDTRPRVSANPRYFFLAYPCFFWYDIKKLKKETHV